MQIYNHQYIGFTSISFIWGSLKYLHSKPTTAILYFLNHSYQRRYRGATSNWARQLRVDFKRSVFKYQCLLWALSGSPRILSQCRLSSSRFLNRTNSRIILRNSHSHGNYLLRLSARNRHSTKSLVLSLNLPKLSSLRLVVHNSVKMCTRKERKS